MSIPRTSVEIRQAFLDFFEEQKHQVVASSPLPNRENPTLLFTNAGMNQFTNVFLGKEKRSYSRAATSQKCMRIQGKQNDLENVGPSPRHHTMFEMLGNFSFGDYFKKDAIEFAWLFLTRVLHLDPQRLWVTIYTDDDEAERYWLQYMPAERILRFGKKDNFWEMGETGPCGPCSEIHYYLGPIEEQTPLGVNNDDYPLYLEIWNLVFMQFERDEQGILHPLPQPSIDTGMGLERICRVMQQADSNYETDLFAPIIHRVQQLTGQSDTDLAQNPVPYRVVADHGRAATFLIADGVLPGNVGEGYVVRMIIRRAARFGRKIGLTQPFLAEVAAVVAQNMGDIYPELRLRLAHIQHVFTEEEVRFSRTLDSALQKLDNLLQELQEKGQTEVPGDKAFTLYATSGLPFEISRDVAKERGFGLDEAGFYEAQKAHALASGAGAFGQYVTGTDLYGQLLAQLIKTGRLQPSGVDYDPYSGAEIDSEILAIVQDGQLVEEVNAGSSAMLITAATPFYIESGGEVSDTGQITTNHSCFLVKDVHRPLPGLVLHLGTVELGSLAVGQAVALQVNDLRRADIRRNHTATHILHRELRTHLGSHVTQAGSLVAPDRLRFDFTHHQAVDPGSLLLIEQAINEAVLQNYTVNIAYLKQKEAIEAGAMALFGEKYGDIVRTVQIMGDHGRYSFELCGGLHVQETGEIGLFHFTTEEAVGAGVRRVEAVTGRGAVQLMQERMGLLHQVAGKLNSPLNELPHRLDTVLYEVKQLQKELEGLRRRFLLSQIDDIARQIQQVGDIRLLAVSLVEADMDGLRELCDRIRDRHLADVAVLASVQQDKPIFVVMVQKELLGRGLHAGTLAREVAKRTGGSGGGRPDLAQAGGKDAGKLAEALADIPQLVQVQLKK